MKRKKLILGLSIAVGVVIVLGGLFIFRDKLSFKADTTSCTGLFGNELDRAGVTGCATTNTVITPTSWIKSNISNNLVSRVTRFVVDCSMSQMNVYGYSNLQGREIEIAHALKINTGYRVLSAKDFVTYRLATQNYKYKLYINKTLYCQSPQSGYSVISCNDQVYNNRLNTNAWVVISDADPYQYVASQLRSIVAVGAEDPVNGVVRKCLPPNIKDSNATPLGTYTIDPAYNRTNPKGVLSYSTGIRMGNYAFNFETSRGLLIHGRTPSMLSATSGNLSRTYGCVRMYDDQVAAIYDLVKAPYRPTITINP